jgi:curved DNA-binding protein CbpA
MSRVPIIIKATGVKLTMTVVIFIIFLTAVIIMSSNDGIFVHAQYQRQQAHQEDPAVKCQPAEPIKYDWERYNYYELLGIPNAFNKYIKDDGTGNNKKKKKKRRLGKGDNEINDDGEMIISNKDIRKAYRKTAQKYHPDKVSNKKKSSNNDSTTSVVSIEESNSRFTKIAEAYEFLSDNTKQQEYNLFLEYCHNFEVANGVHIEDTDQEGGGRISTMLKKRFNGLFDDFAGSGKDPFSLFEEFFFGSDDDDDDDDNENIFDPNDPFSHLHYQNLQQNNKQGEQQYSYYQDEEEEPVRVFHDEQKMYDPMTGENVIRVLQTEEFAPPSSSSSSSPTNSSSESSKSEPSLFYFRIIAQDFKERYDPYNAKKVLVPITEQYLQDDGYRSNQHYANSGSQSSSSTTTSSNPSATIESILHSWEVLTPDSRLIVSPNRRFVAGLSPDCELIIMTNEDYYDNDDNNPRNEIWSSKRPYGSGGYAANNCYALIKGPHIVVTVGQHPHSVQGASLNNNRILWHSDSSKDDNDEQRQNRYYEYEDEYGFWHKIQRSYLAQLDNDGSLTVYSVWNVPQQDQEQQQQRNNKPKMMANKAWMTAKDIWHGRVSVNEEYEHLYYSTSSSTSSSSSITYKRCIYSTSKFGGCNRVGRKLAQLSLEIYFLINRIISKMNHYSNIWLDLIFEEDDTLWELKESVLRNGHAAGSKMIGSSARFVRKIIEYFMMIDL